MQFDVITIFPEIFSSFLKESLIARGQKKRLIKINIHNLRKWTDDRHQTVDDRPFGGGFGMVLKIEPLYRAVQSLKNKILNIKDKKQKHKNELPRRRAAGYPCGRVLSAEESSPQSGEVFMFRNKKTKVILFTPRGKKFNQKIAHQLSKLDRVIMLCGRYEGVDERVAKHLADMELSIGEYVLMGGELPAMVVMETTARLIPGVLGKQGLLKERTTKEKGFIEYPQYTRPEIFSPRNGVRWSVPKVLLSGHHKKIEEWRKKYGREVGK